MLFSNDILIRIVIALLSLCGFLVAKYIHKHKKPGHALICPARFDCHAVVHSDYSKFMGTPLEVLGMIYYALIFLIYLILIFAPNTLPLIFDLFLFLFSMGAFLFSLYLIGVQIFILKKGCLWCFVSAFISISIFILTLSIYDFSSIMQIFVK